MKEDERRSGNEKSGGEYEHGRKLECSEEEWRRSRMSDN